MKKLAVALAALALAVPAAAQERGKIGVGVSIVPIDAGGVVPTVEVYVPLQIAPQLRVEPSIGIFTRDEPTGGVDTSDLTLGVGAFLVQRTSAPVDVYYGGRLKLNFASFDTGVADDSGVDLSLAAAAGGEYYLAPRFSAGLEAQIGFYSLSEASGDASGFFTTGLAFLRVYL